MTHPKGHVTYPMRDRDDYSSVVKGPEICGGPVHGTAAHPVAHGYAKHHREVIKDPKHSRPGMPRGGKV